jgi:hypothetical protein
VSTREALIQEILKQPEPLLRELQRYLAILVEHRAKAANKSAASANVWPDGYFHRTAGCFSNERLERPPQPPFEKREEW